MCLSYRISSWFSLRSSSLTVEILCLRMKFSLARRQTSLLNTEGIVNPLGDIKLQKMTKHNKTMHPFVAQNIIVQSQFFWIRSNSPLGLLNLQQALHTFALEIFNSLDKGWVKTGIQQLHYIDRSFFVTILEYNSSTRGCKSLGEINGGSRASISAKKEQGLHKHSDRGI